LLLFFYRNFVAKIFSQKTSIHTEYYTKFIRFIEQFVIFVAQKLFNMAIGSTIRKLRTAKKLSQQYIADTLNIDRRTYAAWEQESQEIKSGYIPQLAEFFGVEIADLFKSETSINIKQSFKDSTINTAILILTDKEAVGRVLDAIKSEK